MICIFQHGNSTLVAHDPIDIYQALDKNHDGHISKTEFKTSVEHANGKSLATLTIIMS